MPGCPQGRAESRMGGRESDWSTEITRTGCGRAFAFTTDTRTRTDLHKCVPQSFIFIYSNRECNVSIWTLWDPPGFAGRTSLCPDPVDWSDHCSCGGGLLHSCSGPPARSGSFGVSGRAPRAGPTPARSNACGSPTYA